MTDWLTEVLRCPKTGERLIRQGDYLVTESRTWRYPIRSGVPVLLPTEAEEIPG
ncbi:MAG: hypothetical protein Q4P33_00945 [Flaviflexus sp.]|nr:hypothetical protein [Flaviflexus sp.]